ncbi:hypothetical protein C4569_01820 [Candidatus Parcubacteria bacterium]|nr:MAG: hypothetical protein C4569_01820 [Candidatus Parcubacteria bacterium]
MATPEQFISIFSQEIAKLATTTAPKAAQTAIADSFSNWDWSIPTWDLIILVIFFLTVFFYSFALGRDRILGILISTYIALAVSYSMPFTDELQKAIDQTGFLAFKISAFVIVFFLMFFLLFRSRLIQSVSVFSGNSLQIIFFSFLLVGLLTSIILSFLPQQALDNLTFFTNYIFLSDIARFLWIILPVMALAFF